MTNLKKLALLISVLSFLITNAYAGEITVNFKEPWKLHLKTGEIVPLKQLIFDKDTSGNTIVIFQRLDGSKGFTDLMNIANQKEFGKIISLVAKETRTPEEQAQIDAERAEKNVSKSYDKFNDISVYSVHLLSKQVHPALRKDDKLSMQLRAFFKGNDATKAINPSYSFYFSFDGEDWNYLKFNRLVCLIDQERYDLGDADHSGDVGNGYVLEQMDYRVSESFIRNISSANSVECKIGITEIDFTHHMQDLISSLILSLNRY